jgi:hypothetical protein
MKKIYFTLITLLITGTLVFSSCSDDDNGGVNGGKTNITYGDLPVQSQNLITDYFADYEVKTAYKTEVGYDVTLNKSAKSTAAGYEIKFDANGNWLEIEAHGNSALSDNVLTLMNNHRTILLYIEREYPDRGINEIEKEGETTYKLELTGTPEIKLIFSSVTGEYLGLDKDDDKSQNISVNDLPVTAQEFLSTHFNSLIPSKVEKDGDSYDVEFSDKTDLEFYLSGEWKEVEVEGNINMPPSIVNLLPSAIGIYLEANHAGKKIKKIENKINYYEIELAGLKEELLFDKQGQQITDPGNGSSGNNERIIYENLPASIKEFLSNHFIDKFAAAKKEKDEYDVVLRDGTEIEFDLNGNLKSIEVIPNRGYSVPESVMPEAINTYIKSKYPNRLVEEFEVKTNKNYKYKVELSGYPEIELLFDANGNFIRLD